jgi:DNA-directed RNA polymerase specialized sigma24 family protein
VAQAARRQLLGTYRRLLRHEDLEDCYSQATCELIAQARAGSLRYSSRTHLFNTLQLRFTSRVTDRRRALRGRSPTQAVLDEALPFGALREHGEELADPRADVERRALLRCELRSLEDAVRELTPDQRLVLACQIGLQMQAPEFCRRFGWSPAKHRKVAQRARMRLRALLERHTVSGGSEVAAKPAGGKTDFFAEECPVSRVSSGDMAGTLL